MSEYPPMTHTVSNSVIFACFSAAFLISCTEISETESITTDTHDASAHDAHTPATQDPSEITLGNGEKNIIQTQDLKRFGPTLLFPSIMAEHDSFLVLHPFRDGAPVQTDYVAATFVPAGQSTSVTTRLDSAAEAGTPFIVMLHRDVNQDGAFQFGDGITVPDAPVFEGKTLIAFPTPVPESAPVTPDIVHASTVEQKDKRDAYLERQDYRENRPETRLRALIHAWMYEIERPDRSGASLRQLLADDYVLNFSSGLVADDVALDAWINGTSSAVEASRHVIEQFTYEPLSEGHFLMNFTLDWDGMAPGGGRLTAKTNHTWIVSDVPGRTLPQIKRVDVDLAEPFAAAEWGTL